MKRKEMNEVMSLLNEAGYEPRLCNAYVHVSSCPVRCGLPDMPGDDGGDDYLMLPEGLVGHQPELFVPAKGDSMADANFEEGDLLRVRLNMPVHDGDIVVACIDGGATVKVLFTDEAGHRWLVPRNDRYDAIRLTAEDDVRIVGVVVGVEKRVVRASSGDCLKAIRRTMEKQKQGGTLTESRIDAVIAAVAGEVANGRQWYAVYRALADQGGVGDGCYGEFCRRVCRVVPKHSHLPVAKELGRLAVQSFSKHVRLWDGNNAPVSGSRFARYLHIARLTGERLASV